MATLYNQYIYKNGAWMKIGTSSDSVTYALSYSALTGLLTLTGSDGSTSTVTIESGSSDAITGITVNGTTVTVTDGVAAISIPTTLSAFTNDVGYITSYTETDPVFRASAAAGITATDISNWNAKSNTDEKLKVEQASQGTYYPVLSTNSNSASTKVFDTDISYNFGPTLSSLSIGGTRLGRLIIKNGTTAGVRLQANGFLESIVAVNLPTTSGTLALTSDIPTVPTNVSAFTNDAGYLTTHQDISGKVDTQHTFSEGTGAIWYSSEEDAVILYRDDGVEGSSVELYTSGISLSWGSSDYSDYGGLSIGSGGITISSRSGVVIHNVVTPTNATDAVNKQYVDNLISTNTPAQASISSTGLITYKNSGGTSLFTLQLPLYNGGVS